MNHVVLIVSVLFFTACAWQVNQAGEGREISYLYGDTVWVGYKDALTVPGDDFRLSFNKLINDGRCPLDLRCFWEGNAKIELRMKTANQTSDLHLDTYWGWQQDTSLNGYYIALLGLLPHPHTDSSYTAADYRARLVVYKHLLECLPKETH